MGQVFVGARGRFKVNGEKVAFAGGVSGEESIDHEAIDVLDLLEVLEYVEVAYRASLNANIFRVIGQSLKNLGIFPVQANILTSGVLECAIEDTITNSTAYLFQGCKAGNKSFDMSARGVVTENLSFVAIRVMGEEQV